MCLYSRVTLTISNFSNPSIGDALTKGYVLMLCIKANNYTPISNHREVKGHIDLYSKACTVSSRFYVKH